MESTTKLFPEALAHHRAGRLDEAESLYQSILNGSPDHADSLNLLGVIAHQKGEDARAVDLIGRAIAIHPDRPAYHCNLAAAYTGLGRFDDAETSSRTALALDPSEAKAFLNLGLAFQGAKRWPQAEQAYRDLSHSLPQDPRGPQALGDCLREQGRTFEALAAYREALARYPDHGPVHLLLGTMLLTGEEPLAAEPHLRRAVELMPQSMPALLNFGSCLTRLGRPREAIEVYDRARHIAPSDVGLGLGIGQALLEQKDHDAAEQWFNSVLLADPNNSEAICGLADVARARSLPEAAVSLYEQSLRLCPSFAARRGLGDALWELGDTQRAQATMRETTRLYPDVPEGHTQLGVELATEGDFQGAAESLRAALGLQPHFPVALAQLAFNLGSRLPDSDKTALEAALQMPNTKSAQASMHYALAKVEDARDHFAAAEEHFRIANQLEGEERAAKGGAYDPQEADEHLDRIIETFTSDRLAGGIKMGHDSEQPIFVVGMPRSGTTLIEQILSSHPRVFGAGETAFAQQAFQRLPSEMVPIPTPLECIKQLNPLAVRNCANFYLDRVHRAGGQSADRIVDKMPDNYLQLGWLAMMFPKARLIHSRRDPRDVALSCWMANFAVINWSNDMHHIAARIRNYQRLMAHWKAVMPVPVLELNYEDLVFDQEKQSRRLIEFVGLDWDPKCLEFHRTKRVVQTASMTQVRQPMYTRSVGRWRNYLKTVRPLIEELGLGFD